jgi:penicillin-binding protein 2
MDEYRIRVRIFVGIILVVLGILALRLVQLQLVDAQAYTGESRSNAVREVRVQPARGAVFDRDDVLMVDNEPTYTIMLTPRYFDESKIGLLASLLEVPDSVVVRKLKEARQWSAFRPSPAFREVPFDIYSRIQENLFLLPGVSDDIEQKRRYHTDAHAAHVLGYIREITREELERRSGGYRQGDLIGKAGLERSYEDSLRGRVGSAFKLVNARGLEVKSYRDGAEDLPPMSGYDLYLGIDAGVQALAETLFVGKRGGAVAFDPKTGEVIALVSKPDFDPSIFSQSIDPAMWRYLTTSKDRPMFNRATMSLMPPGSTWKPFMSLMALQEGIITESSTIYCPGGYLLGGRFFRCHGGAHGPVTVRRAIQVSCNTFFYALMMRTDVNTWARWAHRFGFGENAPTDIAEQSPGLIPDSAYFNRTFPRGWTPGYTIILGIGQGNMGVTPLQLARYIAAVANGGMLRTPHLVRKIVHPETGEVIYPTIPPSEQIPIDAAYFEVVREGMRLVMEAGTGRGVQLPGIASGGKTGTAQNPHGKDHSVFVMFAPFDDPQIALAVMVENAGFGASVAAPIASLMAEQYLTGQIADTPQRRYVLQRALGARSESLEPPETPVVPAAN